MPPSPPTRISVMTLNLWKLNRWPERRASLESLLATFAPDVFLVQEAAPPLLAAIDAALPAHRRVRDPFEGWSEESSIYWNASHVDLVDHGHATINDFQPNRQLFHARLRVRVTGQTILAATAHFTWPGHDMERETGRSPRPEQSRRTAGHLARLAGPDEPVVFTGDLNEDYYPRKILADAGLVDPFTRLRIAQEPTRPARPIDAHRPDAVHDWIVSNAPARPIAAQVVRFLHEGLPPSDHWPVIAVFELPS